MWYTILCIIYIILHIILKRASKGKELGRQVLCGREAWSSFVGWTIACEKVLMASSCVFVISIKFNTSCNIELSVVPLVIFLFKISSLKLKNQNFYYIVIRVIGFLILKFFLLSKHHEKNLKLIFFADRALPSPLEKFFTWRLAASRFRMDSRDKSINYSAHSTPPNSLTFFFGVMEKGGNNQNQLFRILLADVCTTSKSFVKSMILIQIGQKTQFLRKFFTKTSQVWGLGHKFLIDSQIR